VNRLAVFLLGLLVGGAGVFYWLGAGFDSARFHPHGAKVAHEPGPASVAPVRDAMTAPDISMTIDAMPTPAVGESFVPARSVVDTLPPPAAAISPGALLIPVLGVAAGQLTDTYSQSRGAGRSHDAIDIMAARGTPVLAADDGRVVKLFNSKPGGLTLYQFDRQEKIAYYYAHLDSYAEGVVEGRQLKRGELVGYVGSTGNASPEAPHLHFAVFLLGPEKYWWQGTAINPFPLLGGRSVPAP